MDKREKLYNSFPKSFKDLIEREAKYAGIRKFSPNGVINIFICFYILSLIVLVYLTWTRMFSNIVTWLIVTGVLCVGILMPYTKYSIMADKGSKKIEAMLPDILMLTSSNIKSGLTIDLVSPQRNAGSEQRRYDLRRGLIRLLTFEQIGRLFIQIDSC